MISTPGIKKIVLSKYDSLFTQNVQPLGLRKTGKLIISDDVVKLEKELSVRNYTKFTAEAETVQCGYDMLRDFITVYCADGRVDAHILTMPQQAAADGRASGLKGNEMLGFGWSPNGNGHMGFGFKYMEEYSNGKKETSAQVKLQVNLPKAEADHILAFNQVGTSSLIDTLKPQDVNPGIILTIEHPTGTTLLGMEELVSYKLELESKGDGETIYNRPVTDYISVTCEIVTKHSSIAAMRSIQNISELASLSIKERLNTNTLSEKLFGAGSIARVLENEIADKRQLKCVWKGNVPIHAIDFRTITQSGVVVKQMVFE